MKARALVGLWNAPSEKRYKSFLNTVTDKEYVWLINSSDGYKVFDMDGWYNIMVWPEKEFCEPFVREGEYIDYLEIHQFLEKCNLLDKKYRFMVFPTDVNAFIVSREQLCIDLISHLEQIE